MRVFISYTTADRPFVSQLAARLKSDMVDLWYDEWEIGIGDSIVEMINRGLADSDVLLIVLSKQSLKSRWVVEELNSMMARVVEKRASVLPVLLEECDVPPTLAHRRYANFSDSAATAYAELLVSLRKVDAKQKSDEAQRILDSLMTGWSLKLEEVNSDEDRTAIYDDVARQHEYFRKQHQLPLEVFSVWVRLCVTRKRYLRLSAFIEAAGKAIAAREFDDETAKSVAAWMVSKWTSL